MLQSPQQSKTKPRFFLTSLLSCHQSICHSIITSLVTYMRDLQVHVLISSCLPYFNRLRISLLIYNLSPLESKEHQPTSQLKYHFNHITIYCKNLRLTLILWGVERKLIIKAIQSFYLLLLFNVNSLSAIRLISPTPIDDLLKLSSHPGFLVNANSSSQHAQLKANKVLGNHYSCK